ncbi:hypothetical protein BFP97_00980 [Roseivirga sp. 4D4]|nr:hypothetical protein BFP97_00980 [Roseivirga sp. 4D4]
MFKHNILISIRSFQRFKSTFFINLIGLASGLACALLIYLWVSDEVGIDRFHENDDQLYIVLQHNHWGDEVETDEFTQRMLAASLLEEFPEVEKSISVNEDWAETPGIVGYGEKKFKAKDNQIDPDFFNIFSYRLLRGDKDNPIPNSKSVLISDELAAKLFDKQELAVGKTISWDQERMSGEFQIVGIFESPKQSSRKFDLLFSMELLVERYAPYSNWNSNNERTYLLMKEGTDMAAFNQKIERFLTTKMENVQNTLEVQKYSDRYLYGTFSNAQQTGGRITYVRLFSLVALFILVIASINFMNLTTAKASNRMKEIGVKKAIGARRKTIIWQYMSESVMLSFIALFAGLFLAYAFLPQFNLITGKSLSLSFELNLIVSALLITLVTGLLSGSYPALYLSGLHPISMLKGKLQTTFGDTWLRKGLVVFQFAISAILITAVMVVSQQINYIQSKNLGFDRENLLRFDYVVEDGPGYRAFQEQLRNIPEVMSVAGAIDDATGMHGGTSWVNWPGKDPNQRSYFEIIEVGYDFLEAMGIEMATGRSYQMGRDEPGRSKMIFNEAAIKLMGIEDPIGKVVEVQNEKSEIIGVVKDFHFQSMYNDIHPLYIQLTDELEYTLIRLQSGANFEALDKVEDIYDEHLGGVPFDFTFIDEDFQAVYKSELSISQLSRYFAGVAIIISCLGLLGLAAFTTDKRSKEIGIRKVLGAGAANIIYLLSTDFSKMVILALLIGLPISYFMADAWIGNFAYGINLKVSNFAFVGLLTLLIAWLAVGFQTMKAASTNPVDSLRSE